MSRIPNASPITADIEGIRREGDDEDRSLVGSDVGATPEPAFGEDDAAPAERTPRDPA